MHEYRELLRRKSGQLWYWLTALLIAGLYSALSAVTPLVLDDWVFIGVWRDDVSGGYEFSFPVWWRFFEFIRGYDNGRLANALAPLSTMFSPWKEIFPYLTGLMMAGIAVLVQKFAGKRRDGDERIFVLASVWALMIVCLPWRDTLFARDYALNYIWGAVLTLAFLWLLKCRVEGRWKGGGAMALLCLMAVVAGGWHEGFALPTFCGLGLLALIRRFRLPVIFYTVTFLYLAAALVFMLSPGLEGRAQNSLGTQMWRLIAFRDCLIVVIDVILFACWLFTTRSKRLPAVPIVCMGIIAGGYAMGFCTVNTPRSYFWAGLAGICLAMWLLLRLLPSLGKNILSVSAAFIVAACTAQTVGVIVWQERYKKEYDEIIALLEESETGTIKYDMTLPPRAPVYTLGIPIGNKLWYEPWQPACLKIYLNREVRISGSRQ